MSRKAAYLLGFRIALEKCPKKEELSEEELCDKRISFAENYEDVIRAL